MVDTRKFFVGDVVKPRPGGAIERQRYNQRHTRGTVVEIQDLPAWGYGIKVQWPDEEPPVAFIDANQFDYT